MGAMKPDRHACPERRLPIPVGLAFKVAEILYGCFVPRVSNKPHRRGRQVAKHSADGLLGAPAIFFSLEVPNVAMTSDDKR